LAVIWLLYHHGIVATVCSWIPWSVHTAFPITGNVDSPYFGTGLVGVLLVAGLAAYGAMIAMGPRSFQSQA